MTYTNSNYIKDSIEIAINVANELHPNNSDLWVLTFNYVFMYASEGKSVSTLLDSLGVKTS